MALRTLMLKKDLDNKRKAMAELEKRDAEFEARRAELEAAIEEVATEEQRDAVNEAIDQFESEKTEHDKAKTDLDEEIRGLEKELDEIEAAQAEPIKADPIPEERTDNKVMNTRKFYGMNAQERDMFFAREDVQAFLTETRTAIKEKRALTNVGLTVPEVMLGLIRENIEEYSKLYKHVNVRQISGEGRLVVMGAIPEAVWTDCCANLNELNLAFNDVEVGCWKVGGYFAVCNANLEDSDIDLASELLTAIGQAIGLALDKAILYGTGTRMPLGVVARLAQTEAPADYPATARAWADLHTSNIATIATGKKGADLISEIALAFGSAKGAYSRGEKVWVMNEKTYSYVVASTMATNAAGAIVAGVDGTMPVLGGVIEVLNFIPDNVIIAGYFDLYLLAERAGQKFATSEHVRFLQDQTVMKGTARYDGKPAIAEGFVAIGINGATPTATMSFAADAAN
jgi:HK97 family phage major capsid protein